MIYNFKNTYDTNNMNDDDLLYDLQKIQTNHEYMYFQRIVNEEYDIFKSILPKINKNSNNTEDDINLISDKFTQILQTKLFTKSSVMFDLLTALLYLINNANVKYNKNIAYRLMIIDKYLNESKDDYKLVKFYYLEQLKGYFKLIPNDYIKIMSKHVNPTLVKTYLNNSPNWESMYENLPDWLQKYGKDKKVMAKFLDSDGSIIIEAGKYNVKPLVNLLKKYCIIQKKQNDDIQERITNFKISAKIYNKEVRKAQQKALKCANTSYERSLITKNISNCIKNIQKCMDALSIWYQGLIICQIMYKKKVETVVDRMYDDIPMYFKTHFKDQGSD